MPFHVLVQVGGDLLLRPRLSVTSSDPTVVEVTPGQDSLRATGGVGRRTTVVIRLLSSILSDSVPTLAQDIRIRP